MNQNYTRTIRACFIGYIVQAIVNNFVPLLFITLQTSYSISLSQITLIVTLNFGLQLLVDLLSVGFIDKIGYRVSAVAAHVLSAAGLISLTVLPEVFSDPFTGLVTAVMIYAAGGGLLEVLISPIVVACPTDNKEKAMSILHSFYCWGQVGVVLFSTLFFCFIGIEHWKVLALLWALIPVFNGIMFIKVPIAPLISEENGGLSFRELIRNKTFWLLLLFMVCAGASEQSVSQWASAFAERGLGISKTMGDLTGPMLFAIMMGTSRVFYGKYGEKINLKRFMFYSSLLCMASYLVISLSPVPVLGLIGCGLCGLSVGILWPGTFSMAALTIRGGGTAMFAFLALAGDLGCSAGPTLVGSVSSYFDNNLKSGILAAIVFPVILLIGLLPKKRKLYT
ncbi:MFS transporter [Anaerocolumna xylanovorans]|uniref:Fucose permease n=1 Tax=Anaerocolumna xylanovorans DSM 12503 TaxID=1121345 RepID=A0A1M7YMY7_9FIRM|nr:MFS transporter [Anaerocolumna xylanovorans]SHO53980.1 Fucose permease [Anaerocolumna xylanovorans DSM 12503]